MESRFDCVIDVSINQDLTEDEKDKLVSALQKAAQEVLTKENKVLILFRRVEIL